MALSCSGTAHCNFDRVDRGPFGPIVCFVLDWVSMIRSVAEDLFFFLRGAAPRTPSTWACRHHRMTIPGPYPIRDAVAYTGMGDMGTRRPKTGQRPEEAIPRPFPAARDAWACPRFSRRGRYRSSLGRIKPGRPALFPLAAGTPRTGDSLPRRRRLNRPALSRFPGPQIRPQLPDARRRTGTGRPSRAPSARTGRSSVPPAPPECRSWRAAEIARQGAFDRT